MPFIITLHIYDGAMGLLGTHTVNYPTRHDIPSQELLSQKLGEDVGSLQGIQEKADLPMALAFLWDEVEKPKH